MEDASAVLDAVVDTYMHIPVGNRTSVIQPVAY